MKNYKKKHILKKWINDTLQRKRCKKKSEHEILINLILEGILDGKREQIVLSSTRLTYSNDKFTQNVKMEFHK